MLFGILNIYTAFQIIFSTSLSQDALLIIYSPLGPQSSKLVCDEKHTHTHSIPKPNLSSAHLDTFLKIYVPGPFSRPIESKFSKGGGPVI